MEFESPTLNFNKSLTAVIVQIFYVSEKSNPEKSNPCDYARLFKIEMNFFLNNLFKLSEPPVKTGTTQ